MSSSCNPILRRRPDGNPIPANSLDPDPFATLMYCTVMSLSGHMEARREVNVFRVASGTRHTGARRVRAPRRSNAKPSSIRSPARRSRARAACRVGIALVLAFPGAGCGNGDVRSPTAPDPTPTSVPVAQGLDIVGAPPDGLLIGSKVWLQAHGTYNDGTRKIEAAAWTSSDPGVASVDAEGAVRAHAAGVSTITATAGDRRATVTVVVRWSDLDETFWREFAFNDYECRTPAACQDTGRKYRDLETRVLWRLPTPSPDFFLLADSLDPALVDRIRETIPRAVPQLTGVPYVGRIDAGPLDALKQKLGVEMITIEGIRAGRSPVAPTCQEVTLRSAIARAKVGSLSGCIVLGMYRRSSLTPSLIMHEIGHALGFWHTPNVADVMYGHHNPGRAARFSPLEQHHGRFAYTQPRGATYSEIALGAFGLRPLRRVPSPFDHGGIAVD